MGARPQIWHVTGAYDLVGLCLSWVRPRALLVPHAPIFLYWVLLVFFPPSLVPTAVRRREEEEERRGRVVGERERESSRSRVEEEGGEREGRERE